MDETNFSRNNNNGNNNRHNEHLGVNKMGKNIRKSPLHQPNLGNFNKQQPPQPHVYNISKNDFRNVVQQLTGSPSHSHNNSPRPPQNPPKPPSMRLQKIRPPPLTPISRPPQLPHLPAPVPAFNNSFPRPAPVGQLQAVAQLPQPQIHPGPVDPIWANTAESPISAYMRYLQNSIMDPSPRQLQAQPPPQAQGQPPVLGLLPTPSMPAAFPSPHGNVPALLPSPTSPFPLPSPSGFLNIWSPRSPYPLRSPGFQFPPPLTPNFLSPMSQSGILGPGPQPPPSPTFLFPQFPSGFFTVSSPRWRDQ